MAVGKKVAKASKGRLGSAGKGKGTEPTFDATPEENGVDISHDGKSAGKPHDIRETKAYKKAQNGVQRMWNNYLSFLGNSFENMDRDEQVATVQKFSMAFSIGITVLMISCFYSLLPQQLRVIIVPIGIGAAWWFGSKVISPQIVGRLDSYIHRD